MVRAATILRAVNSLMVIGGKGSIRNRALIHTQMEATTSGNGRHSSFQGMVPACVRTGPDMRVNGTRGRFLDGAPSLGKWGKYVG
jgi:hypothetical protein